MKDRKNDEQKYEGADAMMVAALCDIMAGRENRDNTSRIMVFHIQEGMDPVITECIDRFS